MRKTLLILTPGFPKDEADSTCIPERQTFVRVLKETYPDLNIIILAFQYPFRSAIYNWHGMHVIAFGGKNRSGLYRRLTWTRIKRKLKQLHQENQVIGLLSFWLDECAFIGDRFSKQYNLRHYCWLLGRDAQPGNKYVDLIETTGENLIALSDFLVKEFAKNYGIRPRYLIPAAIDTSLFKATLPERDIDIIGAGSLIPLKRYDVFIDIISLLKTTFPAIKAVICGGGPEMETLRLKIKQLGLEGNLTIAGELPNTEVLALMQRAKVFLHSSYYEGFGVVCLEALYAGAKVVSFVRPMQEVIPNWHIANTTIDMQQKITAILAGTNSYQPVLPYLVHDNVKALMKLFDHKEAAIS